MQTRIFFPTIAILGLILGSLVVALAQVRTISSGELNENISAADTKAGHLSRQVVQIDETFFEGVVIKKVERTMRFVPEVGVYTRTRTTEKGSVFEKERIFINEGNAYYNRNNMGPWKKDEDGAFRRMEIITGPQPFSVSQHTVDSQKNLFETLSISKVDEELYFSESRSWIGAEGLPTLKVMIRGKLLPRVETFRTTTRYEYSSKIKIEAPVN